MNYTIDDINEKALYVLKVDEQGKFFTEYYELDTSILKRVDIDEYNRIIEIEDRKREDLEISHEIKKNATIDLIKKSKEYYPRILDGGDHCSRMSIRSANGQFHNIYSIDNIEFGEFDDNRDAFRIKKGYNRGFTYVSWFIKDLFDSYMLEKAYKDCNEDKTILCNSHRKVGFLNEHIDINNLLSADIETNFSFGNSSYFTMTLYYKKVKVIPYSKIIYYQFVGLKQLLDCTDAYKVYDESWKDSLDFIRDASNEFHENGESSFITKYIKNELEAVCLKLPEYLKTDSFKFYKNSHIPIEEDFYDEVTLKGFDLIYFKAKIIAGAAEFIRQLDELSDIIPMKKYRDSIYNSCVDFQPIIDVAINQLEILLSLMNNEEDILTDICKKIEEQSKAYSDEIKKSEENLEQIKSNTECDNRLIEFTDHYTDYLNTTSEPKIKLLKNSWTEIITLRNEVSRKSSSHDDTYEKLKEFSSIIEDYISENNTST